MFLMCVVDCFMCLFTCFFRLRNWSGRFSSLLNVIPVCFSYLKIPICRTSVLLSSLPLSTVPQIEQNTSSFFSSKINPTDSMSLIDLVKVTLATKISTLSLLCMQISSFGLVLATSVDVILLVTLDSRIDLMFCFITETSDAILFRLSLKGFNEVT